MDIKLLNYGIGYEDERFKLINFLNIRAINKIKNRERYPQISKDYSR